MAAIILRPQPQLDNCLGDFSFHEKSPKGERRPSSSESFIERMILVYSQFLESDLKLHPITYELLTLRKIDNIDESVVTTLLSKIPEDELYQQIGLIQTIILPLFTKHYGLYREVTTIIHHATSNLKFRVKQGINDSILFHHLSPKMQLVELENIDEIFRAPLSSALPMIATRTLLNHNPIIGTISSPCVTKLLVSRLVEQPLTVVSRNVLSKSILMWSHIWKMASGKIKDRDLIKHYLRLDSSIVLSTRHEAYRASDRLAAADEAVLKTAVRTGLIAHVSFATDDDEEERKTISDLPEGNKTVQTSTYLKTYKNWTTKDAAELIRLAISQGADPNSQNSEGQTALHTCENLDIASALASGNNLKFNATDSLENTPIFYMVKNTNWQMIQFLFDHNVKLNVRNKNHLTVADACFVFSHIKELTTSVEHVRILTLLLQQGAELTNRLALRVPITRKINFFAAKLVEYNGFDDLGTSVMQDTRGLLTSLTTLSKVVGSVSKWEFFKFYMSCGCCSCSGCCCCSTKSKVHPSP